MKISVRTTQTIRTHVVISSDEIEAMITERLAQRDMHVQGELEWDVGSGGIVLGVTAHLKDSVTGSSREGSI